MPLSHARAFSCIVRFHANVAQWHRSCALQSTLMPCLGMRFPCHAVSCHAMSCHAITCTEFQCFRTAQRTLSAMTCHDMPCHDIHLVAMTRMQSAQNFLHLPACRHSAAGGRNPAAAHAAAQVSRVWWLPLLLQWLGRRLDCSVAWLSAAAVVSCMAMVCHRPIPSPRTVPAPPPAAWAMWCPG